MARARLEKNISPKPSILENMTRARAEAAPEKALLIYEFCTILVIIVLAGFWLDKPRRKK